MMFTSVAVPSTSPISFPNLGLELNPSVLVFPNSTIPILSNIHWYGLIIGLGFLLAVIYGQRRAKQFGLTEDNIYSMLLCAVPSAIVGARLYYCLTYRDAAGVNPYLEDPVTILYIWQGGLAIYGGVIAAVTAAFIYCRVAKIPFGAIGDIGGLGLLIGQSAGRWGNFFNREAFGGVTDSFLNMGLYDYSGNLAYYHPTFLYESAWNLVGLLGLHFFSKKRKFDGEVFCLYVAWYGLGRFFIEGLRTDSLYIPGTGIRISQAVALASFLAAVGVVLYMRFVKKADGTNLYVLRQQAAAKTAEEEPASEESEAAEPAAEVTEAAAEEAAEAAKPE